MTFWGRGTVFVIKRSTAFSYNESSNSSDLMRQDLLPFLHGTQLTVTNFSIQSLGTRAKLKCSWVYSIVVTNPKVASGPLCDYDLTFYLQKPVRLQVLNSRQIRDTLIVI